jgi:diguanylate cyclase (GGDEF)-like protein/PAS domain S-box-containing protein
VSEQATPSAASTRARWAPVDRLLQLLPQGHTLPQEVWQRRHRALIGLLWLHAIGLFAYALIQGYGTAHSLQEGGTPAAFALVASFIRHKRRLASAVVSAGLITSSAILVHLSGGLIEAHFHFFVMIVVIALYEDWIPYLLAAAYVVVHHGLTGALNPGSVFNHADAVEHPWKWAGIHALFVVATGVASVVAWRLNEDVRAEAREAYRQAYESEQRFKGAFEGAPIGMALTSADSADPGRFIQVNRAMCELTGYPADQLLEMNFREIAHPDDADESEASFTALLEGTVPSYEVEKRYRRAGGQVPWCTLRVSLIHDRSGQPLYAVRQMQDVTERRAAQEQLAHEALHDQLTGLPNRRKLMADLSGLLETGECERSQLVLFDLNGFKGYNDTFGHPAGDALLERMGGNLAAAVDSRGCAYRMGGDEFCVLAPVRPDDPESVVVSAAAALSEHGERFAITASWGSVLLPDEASDPSDALRTADQRMYAQKRSTREMADDQTAATLRKVISASDLDLGEHVDEVAHLSEAVGRKLGLAGDQMSFLIRAAALHDVGKVAIPHEILSKREPLTEEEWAFVRRHTVIGERMLAAAPAVEEVARIVRWSHERFDGHGYPDRLAGEDIPLDARIIAVCDAYGAMTSERAYRSRMSSEEALAELRRCAGSQFDPVIVEAFCAVVSDRERASVTS